MAALTDIGERDRWRCWLCDGPVAPDAPPGDPAGPSLDHVVPRSRGGRGDESNLRLAHRSCNARRRSSAPSLPWPERFGVLDAPELWQALTRLDRRRGRPGTGEVVALVHSEQQAAAAAAWVRGRAAALFGGSWTATVDRLGTVPAVRLAAGPDPARPGRRSR